MPTSPNPTPPPPAPTPLRLPFRAGLALLVIALVGAVIAVARSNGDPRDAESSAVPGYAAGAAAAQAPSTRPASTAPPTTRPTTTQTTLPLPDPPPADPYAPTPRVEVATLTIPRIGLSIEVLDGVTLTVIDQATGHWPGTPGPGELGNMVIAGHRTVKHHPFYRLDELQPGDQVLFDTPDGRRFTYQVRGTIVVPASSIGIIAQSSAHTATLFACHPLGEATERIVVKLRLLDAQGQPVDPDAALPPLDVGNRTVDNTAFVRAGADDPLTPSATEP